MSQFHTSGTLQPITKFNNLKDNCIFILNKYNVEYDETSPETAISDAYYYNAFAYIIINSALYVIKNRKDFTNKPLTKVSRNSDDTIDFELSYNTQSFSYETVLGDALELES